MNINRLIRKNILELAPYSTARDEYKGEIGTYLDANENPYDNGFNRYPDPYQIELKRAIAAIKGISEDHLFLGNGSDEAIDLMYRIFCEPAQDEAIVIKPSYGMYSVSAHINNIKVTEVALTDDYGLDAEALLNAVTPKTKIIFLCSPNNPSGNLLDKNAIIRVVESFEGIVVIDEAYIDFCEEEGFVPLLEKYENMVILQTLSKAWGMAGLRLGMAFAAKGIIDYMTKVKYPYNINCVTQQLVLEELTRSYASKATELTEIIAERELLLKELRKIGLIEKVYPSDANFILIKVKGATALYNHMIEKTVIVRDRSRVFKCADTLRITVGTPEENKAVVEILKNYR